MYCMHIATISPRMWVSASPPKQSFLLFCWLAREIGALPQPCRLALRVTAKQLLAAPILAQRDITRFLVSRIHRGSVRFFLAQFLKARIVADLIPDRIESQQRPSNGGKAIRYLQQPLENGNRVIGIPQQRVAARHVFLYLGTLEWVFGSGTHGHSFLFFGDSGGCFAQTCISLTQKGMRRRRGIRTGH